MNRRDFRMRLFWEFCCFTFALLFFPVVRGWENFVIDFGPWPYGQIGYAAVILLILFIYRLADIPDGEVQWQWFFILFGLGLIGMTVVGVVACLGIILGWWPPCSESCP